MRNSKKSQLVTAFAIVENYIGILTNFLILRSFQITLKLHKNHDLSHVTPATISLRRLCLRPPDPYTVGKLRLSSFCIYKNIGGLLWADFELKLIQTMLLCVVVIIFTMLKTPYTNLYYTNSHKLIVWKLVFYTISYVWFKRMNLYTLICICKNLCVCMISHVRVCKVQISISLLVRVHIGTLTPAPHT